MNKINLDLSPIVEAAHKFPWSDKEAYARFLAQTYYFVSHSTRLLAFAAGMIEKSDKLFFDRFIKHIGEERNHELLAKRDIQELGFDINEFPEIPATRLLWEPQYYKILHKSPMALLGYILVLEGLAANEGGDIINIIRSSHGEKCLNFIGLHTQEDIKHVKEAISLIESLSENDFTYVLENIEQTIWTYSHWLNQIASNLAMHTSTIRSIGLAIQY